MSEYKLKSVTSLPGTPGEKVEAEIEGLDGAKVLLLNTGGKVQALGAKCTHYGAPLAKGVLSKSGRLTCPWHGACFNASTGDVEDGPALDSLATFAVAEKNGAVYVTGDEATLKSGRRAQFKCASAPAVDAPKVLIVGGGSGAIGVIGGLRERGFTGHVSVISNEGYLPIDRPKLSKALIPDADKLALRTQDWYDGAKVEMISDEVTGVDFAGKSVSTKSGATYTYTKLVLATGGTPRDLPLPGFKELDNIFKMRSVHDIKAIVAAIGEKGKKIVIVGSSFIGMEVANATAAGNSVSVIGMEKVALERVLGEKIGAAVQKGIEGKGVKFYMSASVDKAEPSAADASKVGAILLKDGTRIEADLVILGVGVAPATAFLRENSAVTLEKDGSLKTNENFAVAGLEDVYAIGDIATYPFHGPTGEGKSVRIEHWNVAQNSGRSVAAHIIDPASKSKQYTPIFWSALAAQLRYCGNTQANGWDDVVVQGSLDESKFAAFYCKGDTVAAVATVGMDPVMSQASALLRSGKMPSKADIAGGVDILAVGAPE